MSLPKDLPNQEDFVKDLVWENDRAVKQALKNYASGEVSNIDTGAKWDTCFRFIVDKYFNPLLARIKQLESEHLYWNCEKHGQTQNAWGCPECVRELRTENQRLKAENQKIREDWSTPTPYCERCRYFEESDNTCHRYAPRVYIDRDTKTDWLAAWPAVHVTDWCGEWAENQLRFDQDKP